MIKREYLRQKNQFLWKFSSEIATTNKLKISNIQRGNFVTVCLIFMKNLGQECSAQTKKYFVQLYASIVVPFTYFKMFAEE